MPRLCRRICLRPIIDESILLPPVFFSGCDDEKCIPTFCDVRHVLRKLCVLPSLPQRIRYIPDVNSEVQPDPIRPAHQERHTVPLLPRRQHDCFRAKCPFTRHWIRIAVLFRTCISVNSCRTLTIVFFASELELAHRFTREVSKRLRRERYLSTRLFQRLFQRQRLVRRDPAAVNLRVELDLELRRDALELLPVGDSQSGRNSLAWCNQQ